MKHLCVLSGYQTVVDQKKKSNSNQLKHKGEFIILCNKELRVQG